MSTALEIHTGDLVGEDPESRTAVHADMIGRLVDEAKLRGWAGAAFCHYSSQSGAVSIGIAPGSGWPELEALRAYRERNKEAAARVMVAPDFSQGQGSLL